MNAEHIFPLKTKQKMQTLPQCMRVGQSDIPWVDTDLLVAYEEGWWGKAEEIEEGKGGKERDVKKGM